MHFDLNHLPAELRSPARDMSRMHKGLVTLAISLLFGACSRDGATPSNPSSNEAELPVSGPAPASASATSSSSAAPEVDDPGAGVGINGLGVVGREMVGEVSCEDGELLGLELSLYKSPGGPQASTLRWETSEAGGCYPFLLKDGKTEPVGIGRDPDFREISYEAAALVYFEARDGYARVFEHRLPPGAWVKIDEVPGGKLQPWADLLTRFPRHYHHHEGRILRKEPSENSPALVTIRYEAGSETRAHEVVPTGQISGQWGQFEVIEYDGDFHGMSRSREPSRTGNVWKGWLRLIDNSGQPLFWFYTRD